jgi:hypothetical protein
MSTNTGTGLVKQPKPKMSQITKDLGLSISLDSLNSLLNSEPKKEWTKTHQGQVYIPVDRVKNNLLTIFQDYDWAIKDVRLIADSIVVFGTLSVINPITGRTRNLDGVGAVPVQLKSGSLRTDFGAIVPGAIQKNAPAAESFAFKNAASKLGKLFGGGSDEVEFIPAYSKEVPMDEIKAAHGND